VKRTTYVTRGGVEGPYELAVRPSAEGLNELAWGLHNENPKPWDGGSARKACACGRVSMCLRNSFNAMFCMNRGCFAFDLLLNDQLEAVSVCPWTVTLVRNPQGLAAAFEPERCWEHKIYSTF